MIKVISGADARCFPDLFRQVHALRHRVFVEELHLEDRRSSDGLERDTYDTGYAIHLLAMRDDRVAGYQRLLPTTRPHLLSRELRHLCADVLPSGPAVWEVTHYCVAPLYREKRRALGPVGSELLAATVEWALESHVTRLLYASEVSWVGRAVQLGLRVRSLGLPLAVMDRTMVAGELMLGPDTLPLIRRHRNQDAPVLEFVGSLAHAPSSFAKH